MWRVLGPIALLWVCPVGGLVSVRRPLAALPSQVRAARSFVSSPVISGVGHGDATALFGKTRALEEEEGEAGGNGRVPWVEELRRRAAVVLAVLWARCRVGWLRARAYAKTRQGKRLAASLCFLLFAVLVRSGRGATQAGAAAVEAATEVPWSGFLGALEARGKCQVSDVVVSATRYEFLLDGRRCFSVPAQIPGELARLMLDAGVEWRRARARGPTPATAFATLVACGYIVALARVARQMMGGGVGAVGRRQRRGGSSQFGSDDDAVSFDSVAGIDAAKREVADRAGQG